MKVYGTIINKQKNYSAVLLFCYLNEYLSQNLFKEPDDICYQLFLCSTVKNSDFKANTILCDSCIEVFNTTKELLSHNTTDVKIIFINRL